MRASEFTRKAQRNSKIYLDMDGVLADFFAEYAKMANVKSYRDIPPAKADPLLDSMVGTDFFARLPKFPTTDQLVKLAVSYAGNYHICSSPLRGDFANSAYWKKIWLRAKLTPQPTTVEITSNKPQHAVSNGVPNILIDDKGSNIRGWIEAGGIGIKYQADEDSLDVVRRALEIIFCDVKDTCDVEEVDEMSRRDAEKILKKNNFNLDRQHGGHEIWKDGEGHTFALPHKHHSKDLSKGVEHQLKKEVTHEDTDNDLKDVANWMDTTPDNISVEVKQEPIEKFIKQIREMYGTYNEFPEDEQRTDRILKLLKQGAKPMPIYVEANDPDLFVMEGRHRMVAFWLAGMKTIPVAYVSVKTNENFADGGYKEIEFVCANPEYPDATDPKLQKQMYLGLKKIPNVIPLLQDWDEYSEGQKSLSAIYKDKESKQKILALAKQLGVKIDLEQPVSDEYVDRAIRGDHEGQQGMSENFADGKKPGRKGLAKRMGVDCSKSKTELRKIAKASTGEKQRMAHWCANMKKD